MNRILMVTAACCLAVPAVAQTVVEQQLEMRNSWVVLDPGEEAAQTFTNTSGDSVLISAVRFWISRAWDSAGGGSLVLELQGVNASGEPNGTVHWTDPITIATEYSSTSTPATAVLTEWPVSPSHQINAGEARALVLRVTGGSYNATRLLWAGTDTDAYSAGAAFSRKVGAGSWDGYPGYDIDRYFEIVAATGP